MEERGNRNSGWRQLKIFAVLMVMVFAVTLAAIVGSRLSDEALAVLAGAVCGVGAAIPTSLLVVAVSRRRDESRVQSAMTQGPYPPVVVVTPPGGQRWLNDWNGLPSSLRTPTQRHFTVVGGPSVDADSMACGH